MSIPQWDATVKAIVAAQKEALEAENKVLAAELTQLKAAKAAKRRKAKR